MKLEFVELSGFRGFRDKTRFEVPNGFVVLSGHNGTGKSTVLDAIDFALTGTINKFSVKGAKGGGLEDHLWWIGTEKLEPSYVSVGFIADNTERFVVTRSREGGCNFAPAALIEKLCTMRTVSRGSMETLMQTTLIRDEFIAALSLDLPEQTRFSLVREAIGNMVGPDYSKRTAAIYDAATNARKKQEERIKEVQNELGRLLGQITEVRSVAERSADISEALRVIETLPISLPSGLVERSETLGQFIADKKLALREVESARALSQQFREELLYFNSADARAELEAARIAQEASALEKVTAEERVASAAQLDQAERENDQYVAHMNALLEHGVAVGLQHERCPLCDAKRTVAEFERALSATRARLALTGQKMATAAATLAEARTALRIAEQKATSAGRRLAELQSRELALQQKLSSVREVYLRHQFAGVPEDPVGAEKQLFAEQESLIRIERAISVLESSNAVDRLKTLESRAASLRERAEEEAAKLVTAERAVEAARQIDVVGRPVQHQGEHHLDEQLALQVRLRRDGLGQPPLHVRDALVGDDVPAAFPARPPARPARRPPSRPWPAGTGSRTPGCSAAACPGRSTRRSPVSGHTRGLAPAQASQAVSAEHS